MFPDVLRLFGSDPVKASLNATRQFMAPFNAIIAAVAKSRDVTSIKSPWGNLGNVSIVRYNKAAPADVLFRLLLCYSRFPNATMNAARNLRGLEGGMDAGTGEPITLSIILGAILLIITTLGPTLVPMVTQVISDVSGETEKRKAAEADAKKKQKEADDSRRKLMIAGAVVVVLVVGAGIYISRKG